MADMTPDYNRYCEQCIHFYDVGNILVGREEEGGGLEPFGGCKHKEVERMPRWSDNRDCWYIDYIDYK